MSTTKPRNLPELSQFEQNRMRIPDVEWRRYDKMWVALTLDGGRIVSGATDLLQLSENLRAAGENIGNFELEFVDFQDDLIGGQAEVV